MSIVRNYDIDLKKCLPEFLGKDKDIKTILDIESKEHQVQAECMDDILKQLFIDTATWGLAAWERILDLHPLNSDSFQARRNRIYLKLQSKCTSTVKFMENLARRYVSSDCTVKVNEYNEKNSFKIIIDGGAILYKNDLLDAIETYKPAHLAYLIELVTRLMDELELSEDRLWTIELAKKTKEYYPWRGRYFDSSWTFIPQVQFDGGWGFNGEYCFDGIPTGEEDDARLPFRFDGDWAFDGVCRFGYPVSRKILWGNNEPDELIVAPRSVIQEKYSVTLPFDVLTPFDTGWAFGARDGPQETAFSAMVSPVLLEEVSLQEDRETITVLRPILRDIYPLPHILSFDGTWAFHTPVLIDGTWGFGGNGRERFGDTKYEPWANLPILFFDEQRETRISYEEVPLCFDGTWEFDRESARRFGDIIEIPRMEQEDGTPYDGRLFDGSWQFFGLHVADVFWNEDAQEKFVLLEDEPEPEHLQTQEKAILSAKAEFADSVFSQKVFDGTWEFSEAQVFGSGSIAFEGLPTFSDGQLFDSSWAFGLCGRLFDGTWKLGEDSTHFNDSWHFDGEEYFPEDGRKEAAGIGLRSILSDRLEHFRIFDGDLRFDESWQFGGLAGPQESDTVWQISTSIQEQETLQEVDRISVSLALREYHPISKVPSFDGGWAFRGQRPFDGAWQFGKGAVFGEAEDGTEEIHGLPCGEPWFRQEHEQESLFVQEKPVANLSESITRTNTFGGNIEFDGEWSFGEQEGAGESMAVFVSMVLRFDGTWDFGGDAKAFDGTWNIGEDSYSFGENALPRNRFDGTWDFADYMNCRTRFERRWNSFGSITFTA